MATRSWPRFPLMALGVVALLAAIWGGLVRLDWELPSLPLAPPAAHGPLMVSGFLGTVISLERAVALGRSWTYAPPLLTGVGALALITGLPGLPGPLLVTAGSLGLVAVFVVIIRLRRALFTATMGLGALAWFGGNLLWLAGWPIYQVALWGGGFLVLTIAGERLDLARLTGLSGTGRAAFLVAVAVFLSGLVAAGVDFGVGMRLAGAGMIGLALWLGRYDIARWTVRHSGLPRFIAVCLLTGYVWLGVSGLLALLFGGVVAGPHYDAVLHALFLGFVLAMIFGHAPIVFPAVLGLTVSYRPAFYLHLVLLHLTLMLRVIGDLAGWLPGRQWGGLLGVVVALVFLVNTGYAIWKAPSGARGPG